MIKNLEEKNSDDLHSAGENQDINIKVPPTLRAKASAILKYMEHGILPIYVTSEEEVYEVIRSPTKKEILDLCFEEEKTITELAQYTGKSMSTISSHVSDLASMDLVGTRSEGGNRYVKTLAYPIMISDDLKMFIDELIIKSRLEDGRNLLEYFSDVVLDSVIINLFGNNKIFKKSIDIISENILFGFDAAFLYLMRRILVRTYEKMNELVIYVPFIEAARKGHDFDDTWKEWITTYRRFIGIRGKYLTIVSLPDDELMRIARTLYDLFREQ